MSKLDIQNARLLWDDELDKVSGGGTDVIKAMGNTKWDDLGVWDRFVHADFG